MKPFEDKMSFPNREEITEQHEFRTPAEESEEAATPEPTLPCTNFAKVEKSLASLGFFTPSSRRLRNAKVKKIASVHAPVFAAIQVSRWILLDNSRGIV